jgi:L-threonylcarbamoyladenylate synthase
VRAVRKSRESIPLIKEVIGGGGLVCAPTDTLYGLLGSALKRDAVEKVYRIKGRERSKPLIVLFSSVKEMEDYGVRVPKELRSLYPAPLTVILPLEENSPFREVFKREDLAVRVPDEPFLLEVLRETGPLFAPSANPSGLKPAESCRECREYFKEGVELCVEGRARGKPSTLIRLTGEGFEVLREGAFPVEVLREVFGGKG